MDARSPVLDCPTRDAETHLRRDFGLFHNIATTEIILVLIIALLVFGPQKLPQIGRSIGKGLREFRRASQDVRDEFLGGLDEEPPMAPGPSTPTTVSTGMSEPDAAQPEQNGDAPSSASGDDAASSNPKSGPADRGD